MTILDNYKQMIANGDADGHFYIGYAALTGEYIIPPAFFGQWQRVVGPIEGNDPNDAIQQYVQGAKAGSLKCLYAISECMFDCSPDQNERQTARTAFADLLRDLGNQVANGDYVAGWLIGRMLTDPAKWPTPDHDHALRLLRDAADHDLADAQARLGWAYATGWGVDADLERAVEWLARAAVNGHNGAKESLEDLTKEHSPDELQAHIRAAESGDANAQFALGARFEHGQGVPESVEEAQKWYLLAANQGHSSAQVEVGSFCASQNNPSEAVRWWRMAAESGESVAQYNLGICYTQGIGVEVDLKEAFRWYEMCANNGDADAQFVVGLFYAQGEVVAQDFSQSLYWLQRAADQGNERARELLTKA